jgi:acyl carrier protein
MEKQEIEDRFKRIVSSQLGVPETEVEINTSFIYDLGSTSMDDVMLVMAIEEEFGIKIPDEEAEKIATVGQVVDYLEKRLA